MRKTKIICTMGPATMDQEVLKKLCLGGMNVARMNFSHGSHDSHLEQLNLLHIAQRSADALRHADAVAGDARHIRAGDLGQVRPLAGGVVFGQHLLVAGKAAGRRFFASK